MDTISTKPESELLDLLHILAAIMYRPIIEEKSEHDFKIEKYNVESMQERAELFKKKLDVDADVHHFIGRVWVFTDDELRALLNEVM